MQQKLVSIIIPCYNGQSTIKRCLDSILEQSWDNVEVIIVNDGSTDKSEEIINSYIDRFKNKGAVLKYIYQDNTGLGGAINTGIKHFTGDYLCWMDIDDFLLKDSIQTKALFMDNHPDVVGVTTDAFVYDESDLNHPIGRLSDGNKNLEEADQFTNIINQHAIICQGCQMLRSSSFLKANPKREIYPSRAGQNIQMLLPTLYKGKHAYISEALYGYVVYENSMLHRKKTNQELINKEIEYRNIVINTVNSIRMNFFTRLWCIIVVTRKMERNLFYIYLDERDYKKILISMFYMLIMGEMNVDDIKFVGKGIMKRLMKKKEG